jgi:hypothetical protein
MDAIVCGYEWSVVSRASGLSHGGGHSAVHRGEGELEPKNVRGVRYRVDIN